MDQDELPPVANQQLVQQSKHGEYMISGHSNHVISNPNMMLLTVRRYSRNNLVISNPNMLLLTVRRYSRNNLIECAPIMLFLSVSKPDICFVSKIVHIILYVGVIYGVGKHVVTEYYRANNWHKRYGE